MGKGPKTPKAGATVSRGKVPLAASAASAQKSPVVLPQAGSTRSRPSWRFSYVDNDGPWPLSAHGSLHELVDKLCSFETMTCTELEGSGTLKHYPVDELPTKAARERLTELHLDDQTRISRLRIGGAPRLYGFLDDDSTFHVVWWDPKHQVWPSTLRHT